MTIDDEAGDAPAEYSRRALLCSGAAAAAAFGLAACQSAPRRDESAMPLSAPLAAGTPFALGVASGEPLADSVVLWTRLAPRPLDPAGGMGPEPVPVDWDIAEDEKFARIVGRGRVMARPAMAHAVHVVAGGLRPERWYWYRFRALGAESPVGRTRTAPAPGAPVSAARFAFASCQNFEQGYYTAHAHLARENLDFMLFLGDYIYEYGGRAPTAERPRRHAGGECRTLAEYRTRYAQYRADPHLQAAHAAFPWLAIWDDHEVENDYADDKSEKLTPRAAFLARRAAAYKAYYEHMPLRPDSLPAGPDARLYRRRGWGDLLDLYLLDERQYRSDQACGREGRWGGHVVSIADCQALYHPQRTLLGAAQERWLAEGLRRPGGAWTVLAQQLLVAPLRQQVPGRPDGVWTDGWDGYPLARNRLIRALHESRTPNPVFLGGDIHSNWVADVMLDTRNIAGPVVATDFTGTSISSNGIPASITEYAKLTHRHIKYASGRERGYGRVTVDKRRWLTEFRAVETVKRPTAALGTVASYAIESGRPGALAA
jgi:alkaline phosphatase D